MRRGSAVAAVAVLLARCDWPFRSDYAGYWVCAGVTRWDDRKKRLRAAGEVVS
jgi:hypothetical protein